MAIRYIHFLVEVQSVSKFGYLIRVFLASLFLRPKDRPFPHFRLRLSNFAHNLTIQWRLGRPLLLHLLRLQVRQCSLHLHGQGRYYTFKLSQSTIWL